GIREGVESGRIVVRYVDVGPVKKMGRPQDPARRDDWPTYSQAPWQDYQDAPPDVVLVDGRFRVACVMQAVLHGAPTIVIHDFWSRPHYHEVLRFLVWRESAGTMGVFGPSPTFDRAAAEALYSAYQFDSE